MTQPKFAVGDQVEKVTGDYAFPGEVRGVIDKKSGQTRYVVEDDRGILFIMKEEQIEQRARSVSTGETEPGRDTVFPDNWPGPGNVKHLWAYLITVRAPHRVVGPGGNPYHTASVQTASYSFNRQLTNSEKVFLEQYESVEEILEQAAVRSAARSLGINEDEIEHLHPEFDVLTKLSLADLPFKFFSYNDDPDVQLLSL